MANLQKSAQADLKRLVDQIERLQEERKGLSDDIADKMKEAENKGFVPKILRKVLALRKKDKAERDEEDALIATYCAALGMAGTPLGNYAEKTEREEARV